MANVKEKNIIDLIRSIMFSSKENGNPTLLDEVRELTSVLFLYDGIEEKDVDKDNRLAQLLLAVNKSDPELLNKIECLNNL